MDTCLMLSKWLEQTLPWIAIQMTMLFRRSQWRTQHLTWVSLTQELLTTDSSCPSYSGIIDKIWSSLSTTTQWSIFNSLSIDPSF